MWTVCLYRGEFVTPVAPLADGTPGAPHTALRILLSPNGEVVLDSAGYAGHMMPDTPADWVAAALANP